MKETPLDIHIDQNAPFDDMGYLPSILQIEVYYI